MPSPSIDKIRASDGSGNASLATVQSSRSPGSSTIVVDTVAGINTNFMGSMGTPHTFTDPITSETITVISEATTVDFSGHVDGTNLEIDDIAPGYIDSGSEVGDIVIIKPTTQSANEVADILDVAHNDDGSLKDDAVTTDVIADAAVDSTKVNFGGAGAGIWWEEIGRIQLSVAGDTMSIPTIPARKFLKIMVIGLATGGTIRGVFRFNNDSANNYADRYQANNAADTTNVSQSGGVLNNAAAQDFLIEGILSNITANEKQFIGQYSTQGVAGAANAPNYSLGQFKWANTSAQITRVDVINDGSGDFAAGSLVVVLGHN